MQNSNVIAQRNSKSAYTYNHIYLACFTNISNSEARCLLTVALLIGIPKALAKSSEVKLKSSTIKAPWTPELRKFEEYSKIDVVLNGVLIFCDCFDN